MIQTKIRNKEKMSDIEKKIEFISHVYKNTQNMISFADAKANISLSIQSLLITIGLGTSLLSNTFEHLQNLNNKDISHFFYSILALYIISSITGIILSILVYRARLSLNKSEKERRGLLYFGHIAQFPTFDDFFSKVNSIDREGILKEFSHQVYHLSHIAWKKMIYVNISIYFLIFNLCLTIIFLILSGYIISLPRV